MFIVALAFTSCDMNDIPGISDIIGGGEVEDENDEYHAAYNLYVEHAKRNGLEYDDYETWIVGIKGKDGEDGVTPQLRINEETNFWEVSYDKGETWISLDVNEKELYVVHILSKKESAENYDLIKRMICCYQRKLLLIIYKNFSTLMSLDE